MTREEIRAGLTDALAKMSSLAALNVSDGLCQRDIAIPNVPVEALVVDASSRSGVLENHARSVEVDEHIRPSVPALRGLGRPSAITWLVVSVWILAVKRCSVWAWSHVAQKCSEVVAPSVAHRDSSASVKLELLVPRVETSLLRLEPGCVFASDSAANRSPVSGRRRFGRVYLETPTTTCLAAIERVSDNRNGSPARAEAEPRRLVAFSVVGPVDDRQSSELKARQSKCFHGASILLGSAS